MGDIILGTFLIVFILGVLGVYTFLTRRKIEERRLIKFVSILLTLGGLMGFFATALNERLRDDHRYTYFLTLVFFLSQTLASRFYYKAVKPGLPLLILTLLLQIPVIHRLNFSYHNQTLFSFTLENRPGKFWDIEPGSYVRFMYFNSDVIVTNLNSKPSFGINLIPILIIIVLLKDLATGKNES